MKNVIVLGNASPFFRVPEDPARSAATDGDRTGMKRVDFEGSKPHEHIYAFPTDMDLADRLVEVRRTWFRDHADDPPEWITGKDRLLVEAVRATLAPTNQEDIKIGRPKDFKGVALPDMGPRVEVPDISAFVGARLRSAAPQDVHRAMAAIERGERLRRLGVPDAYLRIMAIRALRTNAGRDFQSDVMGATSGQPAAANYIALTANATAPALGDTSLAAEITTAGGGLLRAQAVYSHTAAALTYTLIKTFTANGSDSLPVTLAKIGVLNASSGGSLVFTTLLNATATLTTSGDQVQITETVNIT